MVEGTVFGYYNLSTLTSEPSRRGRTARASGRREETASALRLRTRWRLLVGQSFDEIVGLNLGEGIVHHRFNEFDHTRFDLRFDLVHNEVGVAVDKLVDLARQCGLLPAKEVVHLDLSVRDVEVDVGVSHGEFLVAFWSDWHDLGAAYALDAVEDGGEVSVTLKGKDEDLASDVVEAVDVHSRHRHRQLKGAAVQVGRDAVGLEAG